MSGESIQTPSPSAPGSANGPNAVVDRLIELRLTLERIRPLEARLRPQLDRLLADANAPPDAEHTADATTGMKRLSIVALVAN